MSTKDKGFTGLESAIILIAFVVVAAVFAMSITSTGFFAAGKTEETTVSGYKQASSTVYIEGAIYATLVPEGHLNEGALDKVWFSAGIPDTGQAQDLSRMIIVYTHSKDPETFREYRYHDETATEDYFGVAGGPVMMPGDKRVFHLLRLMAQSQEDGLLLK